MLGANQLEQQGLRLTLFRDKTALELDRFDVEVLQEDGSIPVKQHPLFKTRTLIILAI